MMAVAVGPVEALTEGLLNLAWLAFPVDGMAKQTSSRLVEVKP